MFSTQTTLAKLKAKVTRRGGVLSIDDSIINDLKRLEFIVDAVAYKGLTYKDASALWADGIDTLHDRVETN
jgi:hypothetical protein